MNDKNGPDIDHNALEKQAKLDDHNLTPREYDFTPSADVLKVKAVRPPARDRHLGLAYTGDAGFDLSFEPNDGKTAVVHPGRVTYCETGVAVAIPEGYAGMILPRSGLATGQGLRPRNTPGLIDSSYRGEIIVALENVSPFAHPVLAGDRIAQLILVPVLTPVVQIVDSLDETERGEGGFGSSGS
jgi:dUTP pyrophosphatase